MADKIKKMKIAASELIVNPDGSVYHLCLKPEHLAKTVITVGDTDRVSEITKHFDSVEFTVQNREFKTQTGMLNGKRITVISTGIGTDNIDIVMNELDALVNIDLEKREVKKELTSLEIIRIGTSGSINKNIPLDSFVISKMAIGFDSLLHFYNYDHVQEFQVTEKFLKHTQWWLKKSIPYVIAADDSLVNRFLSDKTKMGITATNVGFYGPQGRILRLGLQDPDINKKMASFDYDGLQITNMEMETAGIYCLAKMMGHRAVSLNAIVADRINGGFSENPKDTVERLITYALERI